MTKEVTFIYWPKAVDTAFRAYYLDETGEFIQNNPIDDGTAYWVGSSRINQTQVNNILLSYGAVKTGKTLAEAKSK